MNIDIRSHIKNNFKNDDKETLRSTIENTIKEQDEITLPGEGVFFELVWDNASDDLKEEILNILEKSVKENK